MVVEMRYGCFADKRPTQQGACLVEAGSNNKQGVKNWPIVLDQLQIL